MAEQTPIEKNLENMAFLQREESFFHHDYNDEMLQYEYLRSGNPLAVEEGSRMFTSNTVGHLSKNLLRDKQYLFVAATTLATRFAIEGGMTPETAYTLSDLFIQRMDGCRSVAEIVALHRDMISDFTSRVAKLRQSKSYSKPVMLAIDYIYLHLQQTITVEQIALHSGLSRSYLSVLFAREVGACLSDYIRKKRVETAQNMLKYSDFTLQQIGSFLAFNSQSHFISVFKQYTNMTPGAYRRLHFRKSWEDNCPQSP